MIKFSLLFRHPFSVLAVAIFSLGGVADNSSRAAEPLPPVQELTLNTKDAVSLFVQYYPGSAGKNSIPIILLHGETGIAGEGSGRDCAGLAIDLQKDGHAVFVPDLRGFGRSKTKLDAQGNRTSLESTRLRRDDVLAMIEFDLEAVRKFIVEQHNAGKLNAELLTVVGFEMGAVLALNWTHYDWNVPALPNLKQGQDVKAIALISPVQSVRGVTIKNAMADQAIRKNVSALVMYGTNPPKLSASGRRLFKTLQQSQSPLPKNDVERRKKESVFLREMNTTLQGTRILASRELGASQAVRDFVNRRVASKRDDHPWIARR